DFGQNAAPAASSPFGGAAAGNSGGFGASNSTGFGGAKPFGNSFGTPQNNSVTPFGGAAAGSTAFGAASDPNANNGTAAKPFTPFTEKDASGTNFYQNVSSMPEYKNFSFEELRLKDYEQNRRF
ncbi:hypothetical protein OXX69_012761, partial [Metschnikowia pulcherrima]